MIVEVLKVFLEAVRLIAETARVTEVALRVLALSRVSKRGKLQALRVLVEAMGVIIEAFKRIIDAVRMFVL